MLCWSPWSLLPGQHCLAASRQSWEWVCVILICKHLPLLRPLCNEHSPTHPESCMGQDLNLRSYVVCIPKVWWPQGNISSALLAVKTMCLYRQALGVLFLEGGMYTQPWILTHPHICIHIHTHTHTHAYTHTYICIHTFTHICTHTHIYAITLIHMHTYSPTHILTHTHTHTYLYIHTHTEKVNQWPCPFQSVIKQALFHHQS